MTEMSTRSVPFELRASGDGRTLSGYAAVFNSPTRIQERGQTFDEIIAPGAFARTINARDRVVMQFDHGQHPFFGSLPLGRIDTLREDNHGLYVETSLNDSWMVEPIRDAIQNGAVTGMSFRFSVPEGGDTWDRSGDTALRTVNEVRLYELGPVVHPAYQDTSVGVRSALNLLDPAQRAALAVELRQPEDAEDTAAASLISQMTNLAAQLASLEADAIAAGDDSISELQAVVSILCSLDCLSDMEAGDPTYSDMPMSMLSATPDEGSLRSPVTPDDGSRNQTQLRAQAVLALL